MSGAGWTAGEDRRLEAALAAHPATLEKGARWTLISEAVGGGRGRRECVARYKAIREAILAQQRRREEKEEKKEKKEEDKGLQAKPPPAAASPAPPEPGPQPKAEPTEPTKPKPQEPKAKHQAKMKAKAKQEEDKGREPKPLPVAASPAPLESGPQPKAKPQDPKAKRKPKAQPQQQQQQQQQKTKANQQAKGIAKAKPQDPKPKRKPKSKLPAATMIPSQAVTRSNQGQAARGGGRGRVGGEEGAADATVSEEESGAAEDEAAGKRTKKKRNRKKKKKAKPWRRHIPAGAVDPISLDPLDELPYPPFALLATEPYDVVQSWPFDPQGKGEADTEADEARKALGAVSLGSGGAKERELGLIREQWGDAVPAMATDSAVAEKGDGGKDPPPIGGRYYHLFDGKVLAYYLVSQLQFIDPLNRRDLTRPEIVNLDDYLRRHRLGKAGVTEAYDARGVTESAAGIAGQTVAGRSRILQQEARALLGSLFGGEADDQRGRSDSGPAFENELQRRYTESEQRGGGGGGRGGGRNSAAAALEGEEDSGIYAHEEGGMLMIDDDVNPGLRGGIAAASESARRREQETGRGGMEATDGPALGEGHQTLWSAGHISDQYGHTARVRADNFPTLQSSGAEGQPPPSRPTKQTQTATAKPSSSLRSISKVIKKSTSKQMERQKKATEEARRRAALSNVSFHVPGIQPTGTGGDGIGAAVAALNSAPGGASASAAASTGQLERNRAMADALGVQPATMRGFNSGWARPTEASVQLDEFGNELNAAQYPDSLIIESKERMGELLKLEKRWKGFLADDNASSHALKAMPRDLRIFVHHYSDFWRLHTESFDPEPRRYIHCAKMKDTAVPHPLLSEAARKWRGPGTGAQALTKPILGGGQQERKQPPGATVVLAREIPQAEDRVPLKLQPRTVPPDGPSVLAPPGGTFDMSSGPGLTANKTIMQEEDHQPADRFSQLHTEAERPKLNLAQRSIPRELPVFHGQQVQKGLNLAETRERMERKRRELVEKKRKEEEKAKNILAAAFASSDEESVGGDDSSDWGEEAAVFEGSDDE